jgi:hypothetical protein
LIRWDDSFYAGGIFVALSGVLAYAIGEVRAESDSNEDEEVNNNHDDTDEKSRIAHRN